MSEWTETTLGAVCDAGEALLQTGPFGSQLHSCDYTPTGAIVVATEGIGERRIVDNNLPRVPPEIVERLARHVLREGDILFARRGAQATGRSALVTSQHAGAICGTGAILLRLGSRILTPEFLSFFLISEESVRWLKSHAVGAVMPNLNEGVLRRLPLRIPPLDEQRAIAQVLGALDDKIELNRRMNETLEGIARALFKSWFVDFDPVFARTKGIVPYGMEAATAALFPDRFEDSELGPIPKGWRVGCLGDCASELETGKRPKGGVTGIDRGVPSVGAESIVRLGFFDFTKTKYVSREYFESMKRGHIRSRDVLIYKDGGRPGQLIPHVSMFGDGFPFDEFCINEHVYRVRGNTSVTQNLLYFALSSERLMAEMANKGVGVAVPGLNTSSVNSLTLVLPPEAIVMAFDVVVEPLVARILANSLESKTLAELRNGLLPKLLSGEIRLEAAAEKVDSVAKTSRRAHLELEIR